MGEDEAEGLYVALLQLLRERGLGWLADQVEAQVEEGEPGVVESTKGALSDFAVLQRADDASPPAIPRAGVLSLQPYSAVGRVRVLAEAIQRAVIGLDGIEQVVRLRFAELFPGQRALLSGRVVAELGIGGQRSEARQTLQGALDQLFEEIQ